MPDIDDPFSEARARCPVHAAEFQGETLPMILSLKKVRAAAKDWRTFSSDAPRRVPIPSEEDVRTVRQYPLEVDPPVHAEYRKLVEPFFLRPKQPEVAAKTEALVHRLLADALSAESVEVVHDFAIPLQSHALTYLLNVDEKEAQTWIGWGIHVFKDGDGMSKGPFMQDYCRRMFETAEENPGEDFFSTLNRSTFHDRPLTMEEKLGFANIAFAGGRDTIIHTVTRIIAYFASHTEALALLREHPEHINTAAEEFFRVFMPLTHIGRVCPQAAELHGHPVPAGGRISLAWSAANLDPEVFDDPRTIRLNRRPNPHIAFGSGIHSCLGAHHARAIMRTLLRRLAESVAAITVSAAKELVEREKDYSRMVGYEELHARFQPR